MGIYRQGTKFTIREGKLTIFQKDKKYKTDNWYGRCDFGFDIGQNNYLVKCNKQQRELNLILSLREKGTKYKDIKSYMERYTGRKWFISFIHKLIKRDKEEKLYLKQFELSKSKEMRIRDELKQIGMERTVCDV